ncbi:hypothetical protein VNO80_17689 [Phaseolus coccineus]|uniref:Uncharacterized protein n=1 Tax=Phaseolus coccineus TaxID=3886 RepID=A0AAN9MG85_PHACN
MASGGDKKQLLRYRHNRVNPPPPHPSAARFLSLSLSLSEYSSTLIRRFTFDQGPAIPMYKHGLLAYCYLINQVPYWLRKPRVNI